MSFWVGLAQGVKENIELKERDAERTAAKAERDESRRYDREMDAYNKRRQEVIDARAARAEASALEQLAYNRASEGGNLVSGAVSYVTSMGGSGSSFVATGGKEGPTPAVKELKDSSLKLNSWLTTLKKDESLPQEDLDYLKTVDETLVTPEDRHEYYTFVQQFKAAKGSMPTVDQLRNLITVTQVEGYTDNIAKARELVANISGIDTSTVAGIKKAKELTKALMNIDLNSATIEADTSQFKDNTDLFKEQSTFFKDELISRLSEKDSRDYEIADDGTKRLLMSRYQKTYGPALLEELKKAYPGTYQQSDQNPAFHSLRTAAGSTPANAEEVVPPDTTTPAPTQVSDEEVEGLYSVYRDNPNDPGVISNIKQTIGPRFKELQDRLQTEASMSPESKAATFNAAEASRTDASREATRNAGEASRTPRAMEATRSAGEASRTSEVTEAPDVALEKTLAGLMAIVESPDVSESLKAEAHAEAERVLKVYERGLGALNVSEPGPDRLKREVNLIIQKLVGKESDPDVLAKALEPLNARYGEDVVAKVLDEQLSK